MLSLETGGTRRRAMEGESRCIRRTQESRCIRSTVERSEETQQLSHLEVT